jgi:two-component system response regulator AtoC
MGHSILVVDDEKLICDFLKRFLIMKGFDVATTLEAQTALTLARERPFEIVFLDMRMPKTNGFELLVQLKPLLPKAFFILMTGYAVDEMLEEALRKGASIAIRKPFNINDILKTIDLALKKNKE